MFNFFILYLKYLIKSKGADSVHSPFVYNIYFNVIKGINSKEKFKNIELLRTKLLKNKSKITIEDYGAGSIYKAKNTERQISKIIATSSMKTKYCRMLASLTEYAKPENIIELGTSLGFSTMYMAAQCPNSKIFTIEGAKEIYNLACQNFKEQQFNNIYATNDIFDNALEKILKQVKKIDFVLFDGNHKKMATLNYFEKCLPYTNNSSVFVFDDINWSKEMREAWEIIKKHPEVKISIDLFFCGLVFFRTGIIKQHFCLRY